MKFAFFLENSESRGQIVISRHSRPTFPQTPFPAVVDALCFHTCRPRRLINRQLTPVAMPPCHLSTAPWPFGLHWHPFRNLWVPKAQLLWKYHAQLMVERWNLWHWESIKKKKSFFTQDTPRNYLMVTIDPAACLGLVSPSQQVQTRIFSRMKPEHMSSKNHLFLR